jgi:hypothetical protein
MGFHGTIFPKAEFINPPHLFIAFAKFLSLCLIQLHSMIVYWALSDSVEWSEIHSKGRDHSLPKELAVYCGWLCICPPFLGFLWMIWKLNTTIPCFALALTGLSSGRYWYYEEIKHGHCHNWCNLGLIVYLHYAYIIDTLKSFFLLLPSWQSLVSVWISSSSGEAPVVVKFVSLGERIIIRLLLECWWWWWGWEKHTV